MLISVEYYTQLIEQLGFLKGKNRELEKQLEELKRPEEAVVMYCEGKPYIEKRYYDNVEYKFLNAKAYTMRLKGEISRLEAIKNNCDSPLDEVRRINGKIEGIEYAIKLIEEEKCEK